MHGQMGGVGGWARHMDAQKHGWATRMHRWEKQETWVSRAECVNGWAGHGWLVKVGGTVGERVKMGGWGVNEHMDQQHGEGGHGQWMG